MVLRWRTDVVSSFFRFSWWCVFRIGLQGFDTAWWIPVFQRNVLGICDMLFGQFASSVEGSKEMNQTWASGRIQNGTFQGHDWWMSPALIWRDPICSATCEMTVLWGLDHTSLYPSAVVSFYCHISHALLPLAKIRKNVFVSVVLILTIV
jgi:hypothetical protein